jgi:hypothetical protein
VAFLDIPVALHLKKRLQSFCAINITPRCGLPFGFPLFHHSILPPFHYSQTNDPEVQRTDPDSYRD